jgi:hypothetical protein
MKVYSSDINGPFFIGRRDYDKFVADISAPIKLLHHKCEHKIVAVKAGPNYRFFECKDCGQKLQVKEWIEL